MLGRCNDAGWRGGRPLDAPHAVQRHLVAEGVVLKLKTADFQTLTRSRRLKAPTDRSAPLIAAAQDLLAAEATGDTAFRLIGLGAQPVRDRDGDPAAPDLFGPG